MSCWALTCDRHLPPGEGQLAALLAHHQHQPRVQARAAVRASAPGCSATAGPGRPARRRGSGPIRGRASRAPGSGARSRRAAGRSRRPGRPAGTRPAGSAVRPGAPSAPDSVSVIDVPACARPPLCAGDQAADRRAHPGQERQRLHGAGHQKARAASRSVAGMARALVVRAASWRACAPVRPLRVARRGGDDPALGPDGDRRGGRARRPGSSDPGREHDHRPAGRGGAGGQPDLPGGQGGLRAAARRRCRRRPAAARR